MADDPSDAGSFAPFRVRCVSCQARLKVTDAKLIGTVVACPKCRSFVQIEPPSSVGSVQPRTTPQVALGDEGLDSQALTEAGMSTDDLPPFASDTVASPFPESRPVQPTESSPESESDALSPQTTNRRPPVAMWVAGTLVGVTILTLGVLWWRGTTPEPQPIAMTFTPDPISTPDATASEISDPSEAPGLGDPPINPMTEPPPTDDPPMDVPPMDIESIEPPSDMDAVPNDLIPSSPLESSAADGMSPVLRGEPKDSSSDAADGGPPVMELPPEFEAFQVLLDLPGAASDAPPMSEAPLMEDVVLDVAAEEVVDPMLIATPPEEIKLEYARKMRIAISTKGYPLSDMVLVIGEATLIPIQMDWVSMDLAGTPVRQPVAADVSGWTTIGELIDSITRSCGLVVNMDDNRMSFTLPLEVMQAKTKSMVATDDFGDEMASANELLSTVVSVVDLQPMDALHLRCFATESLRRMRGLPSTIDDEVMQRWTAEYSHQPTETLIADGLPEAWPILSQGQTGPQLDTPIAMAGLLRRTARLNNATCVLNWTDAQRRRLSPGQLVMAYAGGADDPVTAGEMLDETLSPMGLQVRVVDANHWWVGTSATYDRLPIVVRSEPLGPRRDDVMQRMQRSAALLNAPLAIVNDPVSDGFLAVMPRFLYRQLPKVIGPDL